MKRLIDTPLTVDEIKHKQLAVRPPKLQILTRLRKCTGDLRQRIIDIAVKDHGMKDIATFKKLVADMHAAGFTYGSDSCATYMHVLCLRMWAA